MATRSSKDYISENAKGNVIFQDGFTDGMKRMIQEMMGLDLMIVGGKKV